MSNRKTILGLLGFALALALPQSAIAAERVVMRYNVFERSVSVDELTEFAETGKRSRDIKAYLRASKQDPAEVRRTLTDQVDVSVTTLDRVLNSPVGNVALDQLSQYIHTSSRRADKEAMRAALVLSATEDDNVSLIEIAQNYPTEDVYLDGEQLLEAYHQVTALRGGVENILDRIRGLL
jgi:Alpha/beta hydrolase of unknown function (DUF1400)